jgi:ATP-dependent helicase/nuclease subunit A
MLVSRIVRALLDGAAPSEILAITFTRKAAGEMRTRLNEWLRQFAAVSSAERIEALQQRGLTPANARRMEPQLAGLHAALLSSGQAVQINTFHAWFAQLLRLAPLEMLDALGLHPAMTLIEEVDDQMGELMRRFQRVVLDTPPLLQDYRALLERHGRWRLERWLRAAIDKRVEIERGDARGTLQAAIDSPAQRWPDCAGMTHPLQRLARDAALRGQLSAAMRQLHAQAGKGARDAAAKLALALESTDLDAAFALARDAVFTKDGAPRKLGDLLMDVSFAVDALDRLGEQAGQQDAHDDHERMVRLARVLLDAWRALKRERSLMDMPDLEACALALLSDPASAGWVQQRLDVQLRHVLIDEFQDTSHLQWQALQAWLSSYAGAGGGVSGQRPLSVFIVGDPKQSIYRFRGAEPRVFDAARRFIVEGLAGHDLACNHTRRNAVAVLDAVNAVFERATASGDYAGFVAHSTQRTDAAGRALHLPDPPVEPKEVLPPRDGWRDSLTEPRHEAKEPRAQDEARRVAQAVLQLLREGIRPEQVMVLARRRASLALVVEELQALHLPCVAAEELRLADLIEVQDLVDVLDVIASHGNDLALARALKSPLFGAGDAELVALAQRADRQSPTPWWSALQGWADAPPALARARGLLAQWAADAAQLPPHDLLDRVVHQGDLMARLGAAVPPQRRTAAFGAVNALLGLALSLDGGRHASVYRFVRALRQRALAVRAPARDDAVQLLTVHGAKGLEADCVLLIDADPYDVNDSEPGLLIDWPVERDAPRRVAFVADLGAPCASLADLRALEQQAAQREELNALYVAMTRARERLLLSRTPSSRTARQLTWWARVQPHVAAWAAAAPTEATPAVPTPPARIADWPILSDGRPTPLMAQPSYAARLGRAVHRVLQWALAAPQPFDVEALAAAAVAEFQLPPSSMTAAAEYARRILESPALQHFFDPRQVAWSADEFDVMHDGMPLRIDRLVRLGLPHASTWWVLDYKLALDAADDPTLRAQLGRYRAAVQSLAGGESVRAALITGDGALHEFDAAALPAA